MLKEQLNRNKSNIFKIIIISFVIGFSRIILNNFIISGLDSLVAGFLGIILMGISLFIAFQTFVTFKKMSIWISLIFFISSVVVYRAFPFHDIFEKGLSPYGLPHTLTAGFSFIGTMFFGVLIWVILMKFVLFAFHLLKSLYLKIKQLT